MRALVLTCICAAALCCAACTGSGYTFPKGYLPYPMVAAEFAAENTDLRYVVGSAHYSTRNKWEMSPFYRIGDETLSLPVQVLVNNLDMGCIVPGAVFAMQPERVACPNGWRFPRPTHN